jgi:hypothetical protein
MTLEKSETCNFIGLKKFPSLFGRVPYTQISNAYSKLRDALNIQMAPNKYETPYTKMRLLVSV